MLRKFKKVIVLFLSLVIFMTSFELSGFEVQAANYSDFTMNNSGGTAGVDYIYYKYTGGCPGNFEPTQAIPWYTWAGVAHSWQGFLDAGGHYVNGSNGCWVLKKSSGSKVNIYDDGDKRDRGYNVNQTKMGVEYNVDGWLYEHGNCRHFPSWVDEEDYKESMRSGTGEHVNRVGNVNANCNVCGRAGSGNSVNKVCNGSSSNGKHLWYGDIRGLTKCWHCGYTLPALQLGSCSTQTTLEAKWGFKSSFTGDDPSSNQKFSKSLDGSGTASMIIKYGGSFKIDLSLYNYTRDYKTVVTQCYFTKTSPSGVTTVIANDNSQPNAGGTGGNGYNYALPSDPTASTWSHNYSISFDNVTESGWVYNFIIKDKNGNVVKSPDIKVDTTIVFFDYSPNDGVNNNELYYNKGHLIDNSGTVHSADGSANSDLNVAHTRTMVQSRALDPSKSYSTDGSKTVNLPQATLFWRYDLYPRTIGSANIAMNSTDADTNSGNNYKVLMPDYFKNKVFDFDDGIDTNKTDSSGNATSLNDASKYSNQTARAGVTYHKSDANGTRYKYSLYNTESLVKWILAKRDLVAATGKTPVVGTQVSNTTSPNALGVVGKHWANAVYEMDVNQSTNRADLQLPRPERYLAIKLVDLDGTNIQTSDLVDGTLTSTSQAYNRNVKSTSFTVEDYNVNGQLAKGGTYLGANLIPNNYSGVYLTYRFGFDGWYSTASGLQPIYHTHTNSCYRGITHTHDGTCYTAITHKHLIDHIHDMTCDSNGCTTQSCYQYEYHKHTGSSVDGGGCYQGAAVLHYHYYLDSTGAEVVCNDVSHRHNTASGCFKKPVTHQHTGSTAISGTNKGGAGTCYETPTYHSHTGSSSGGGGCYTVKKTHTHTGTSGSCYQASGTKSCGGTYSNWHHTDNAGDPDNYVDYYSCNRCGAVKRWGKGKSCTNKVTNYVLVCTTPALWYELGCGKTTSTVDSWNLSCTKTPGETIDYYVLSCDRTGLADSYELNCGKTEETIIATNLICPLTENDVTDEVLNCTKTSDGQTLVCGMTEQTITGYKSVSSSSKTFTRYRAPEGYVSDRENVDLYARWLSNYDMQLPQVNKPGYQFVGWYTIPQTQPNSSGTNMNDGNNGVRFPEAKRVWSDGVTRDAWAGGGYGRDTTFRLNSVNLDDSSNVVTLYAWFNRTPIYADVYEGLFFEGQSVTLKDLTRLIAVFDWETDYYTEAIQKVYNLPTIDRKNMYVDIVEDKDNTYKEDEDDITIGGDLDEIDKEPNRVIVGTVFDSTRWICKGWVDANGNIVAQNTSGAVDGIYQYIGSEKGDLVETKDGVKYYEKGTEENGVFTGFTYYTADAKQHIESLLNASKLDIYVKEIKYDVTDYLENKQETFNTRSVPLNQYENVKIDTSSDRMVFRTDDEGGFKDTSRFYGEFYVTFEVTDNGILAGSVIQADSPITITYTRKCKIDYNDPPLLYITNLSIDNRENLTYAQFEQELLASQVVIDAQDSQTNVPWWTKKQTQEALQATKKVTGLANIKVLESVEKQIPGLQDYLNSTYNHPSSLWSLKDNTSNFNALPIIGVNTFTNNDIWEAIMNFDVLIDAYDQFGKHVLYGVEEDVCGSGLWYTTTDGTLKAEVGSHNHTDCNSGLEQPNKGLVVSDGVGNLLLSDIDQLRTPDEYRSVYIMLISPNLDLLLDRVSLTENIRYINDEYLSTLGGSYYGTVGYGLEKLTEALDNHSVKSSPNSVESGQFYIPDTYTNTGTRDVSITVNDYSN